MADGVPARKRTAWFAYRAVVCVLVFFPLLGLPLRTPTRPGSAAPRRLQSRWSGGRFNEQALRPLFAPHERANASPAQLVARLSKTSYAGEVRRVFGANVLADEQAAMRAITYSLAQYRSRALEFRTSNSAPRGRRR